MRSTSAVRVSAKLPSSILGGSGSPSASLAWLRNTKITLTPALTVHVPLSRGYRGRVVSATESTVRMELEAAYKTVTVKVRRPLLQRPCSGQVGKASMRCPLPPCADKLFVACLPPMLFQAALSIDAGAAWGWVLWDYGGGNKFSSVSCMSCTSCMGPCRCKPPCHRSKPVSMLVVPPQQQLQLASVRRPAPGSSAPRSAIPKVEVLRLSFQAEGSGLSRRGPQHVTHRLAAPGSEHTLGTHRAVCGSTWRGRTLPSL